MRGAQATVSSPAHSAMDEHAPITVSTRIAAPPDRVWARFTLPEHITGWNAASDEWHCPKATNDLRVGGDFSYTMAARDGSFSFDFGGTYTAVEPQARIAYTLGDGRRVEVRFEPDGDGTRVTETFDPETLNPAEMQRGGWQAILDRFKAYAEAEH